MAGSRADPVSGGCPRRRLDRLPHGSVARGGGLMSKEKIMEALQNEELKKQLLEELEVEELEERVATKPWLCYMPVP